MAIAGPGWDSVVEGLRARGADSVEHPGGTLLEHLRRVADRLGRQGADPDTVAAGLCHAAYGTAGFPQASPEDGWPWTLHDRFTGARVTTPDHVARALLDITVANEIDMLDHARLSPAERAALAALVAAYQSARQ
jgi:hypothetical protein